MDNTDKSILVKPKPWGLQWALLFQLFVMAVFMLPDAVCKNVYFVYYGFDKRWLVGLTISASLGMVAFTLFAVKRFRGFTWRESLQFLGYKRPGFRPIVIGLLSLVPTLLFYVYAVQSRLVVPADFSPLNIVYTVVLAGLFEETFYRGFIFRMLRRGRSFFSAAILSGLFWAMAHIGKYPFSSAFDWQMLGQTMISVLVQSIPAALLFERSGNVIWGWMTAHIGYDLILNAFGPSPLHSFTGSFTEAQIYKYAAAFSGVLIVWGLIAWLLPPSREKSAPAAGEKESAHFRENWVSAQWRFPMIAAILAMAWFIGQSAWNKDASEKNDLDQSRQMADANPDEAAAHLRLGLKLEAYNHPEQAVIEFKKAIELDPNNYMAYVSWGECLYGWKDYDNAIPMFQKALQIDPDYGDAYYDWGYSLEGLGKYDEALPMLEKAIQLNPNEAVIKRANAEIEKIKNR